MISLKSVFTTLISLIFSMVSAQQKKAAVPGKAGSSTKTDGLILPITNADLGVFPYLKTLPNFAPSNESDSITNEQNSVYFYDGKTYITIEGQVSAQRLNVKDDTKKLPSAFQIIQEFDKMVATLGGKKIYAGKLPQDELDKLTNSDIVDLAAKHQLAPSAHYGVVEYVIKTPDKEVWIQLVPASIASNFYNLLVVEKQIQLLTTNINKENILLKDLEKYGKATIHLSFALDDATLLTESKDELLNMVGIFQTHPEWKIKIEINNAPVGKADYILALTQKRAAGITQELKALGVKGSSLEINGVGDTKPISTNDTEQGRLANTRVEITKQ